MRTKCKQCGSKQVIPIDTPKGQELFAPLKDNPYLRQPTFTDKLQGFIVLCVILGIIVLIGKALDDDNSTSYSSSRSITHAERVEDGFYIGLQNVTGTQFEKDSFKCVGAMSVFDAYKTEGNYSKKKNGCAKVLIIARALSIDKFDFNVILCNKSAMTARPEHPFNSFGKIPNKITVEDKGTFNPKVNIAACALVGIAGLSVAAFIYVARMQDNQAIAPKSGTAVEMTAPRLR